MTDHPDLACDGVMEETQQFGGTELSLKGTWIGIVMWSALPTLATFPCPFEHDSVAPFAIGVAVWLCPECLAVFFVLSVTLNLLGTTK